LHTIYRDVERRGLAAATTLIDADEAHLRRPAGGRSGE